MVTLLNQENTFLCLTSGVQFTRLSPVLHFCGTRLFRLLASWDVSVVGRSQQIAKAETGVSAFG